MGNEMSNKGLPCRPLALQPVSMPHSYVCYALLGILLQGPQVVAAFTGASPVPCRSDKFHGWPPELSITHVDDK